MAERRNPQRSIYPDPDEWLALRQYALDHQDTASAITSRLISTFLAADDKTKARMMRGTSPAPI